MYARYAATGGGATHTLVRLASSLGSVRLVCLVRLPRRLAHTPSAADRPAQGGAEANGPSPQVKQIMDMGFGEVRPLLRPSSFPFAAQPHVSQHGPWQGARHTHAHTSTALVHQEQAIKALAENGNNVQRAINSLFG